MSRPNRKQHRLTSQMDLKQKIEDNGRLQKDSRDKLKHWSKRHEELELVYVE